MASKSGIRTGNDSVLEILFDSGPWSSLSPPIAGSSGCLDFDNVPFVQNDRSFHWQSNLHWPASLFLVESDFCSRTGSAPKKSLRPVSSSIRKNCDGDIIG